MDTMIFLIALGAVLYILFWAIRNDDLDEDEPTHGLFRMKEDVPEQGPSDDG